MKRKPKVSDEVLLREAHMLSDDVLLLPKQVGIIAGLSDRELLDRRRADPPKPPLPEPRDPDSTVYWYSLGAIRAYKASLREGAAIKDELRNQGYEDQRRFSAWLSEPGIRTRWPCALIGSHKRPVDIWATIRGEVVMTPSDKVAWLTRGAFLAALAASDQADAAAQERAAAMKRATRRQKQSLAKAPTRSRGRRVYS
jgi:hypothetical protein